MTYKYQIVNIPWINSTVEFWNSETPETKTRLVVVGLCSPAGIDEFRLKTAIELKMNLTNITVERAS